MPIAQRPDMDGYGVSDTPDGLLPWQWASKRLVESRNYWISTTSGEGRPHSMPVWGIWLPEEEEFVFACAPTARKARNLRANPLVVVAADHTVEVVSVEGVATEIRTSDIPDVIARYAEKYESDAEKQAEMREFLADTCAFRIAPERAFGLIETPEDFGPSATRWVW